MEKQESATIVEIDQTGVGPPPAAKTARSKRVKLGVAKQLVNARKNLKAIKAAVSFEHHKFPADLDGQREARSNLWFMEDSTEPQFGFTLLANENPGEELILYAQAAIGYTVCRLELPNGVSATTISICSGKDRYHGKIGEMVSLRRALNALAQPREVIQQIFHEG